MRRFRRAGYHPGVAHPYPPLNLEVRTPRLTLAGASDELLERLVPLVRAGIADAEPWPFDDPISFYADSPEREWQWLRGIWTGRGRVSPDSWRLYFAVLVDGEPVGMQDLKGKDFTRFGTSRTAPTGTPAAASPPGSSSGGSPGPRGNGSAAATSSWPASRSACPSWASASAHRRVMWLGGASRDRSIKRV